jgi:hypothetical protein
MTIRRRCRCLTAGITHTHPFVCTRPAQHLISMLGYQSSRHGAVCQYDDARWTRAPGGAVADRNQIPVTRVADHGYLSLIQWLTCRGASHRDLHLRGDKEKCAGRHPVCASVRKGRPRRRRLRTTSGKGPAGVNRIATAPDLTMVESTVIARHGSIASLPDTTSIFQPSSNLPPDPRPKT